MMPAGGTNLTAARLAWLPSIVLVLSAAPVVVARSCLVPSSATDSRTTTCPAAIYPPFAAPSAQGPAPDSATRHETIAPSFTKADEDGRGACAETPWTKPLLTHTAEGSQCTTSSSSFHGAGGICPACDDPDVRPAARAPPPAKFQHEEHHSWQAAEPANLKLLDLHVMEGLSGLLLLASVQLKRLIFEGLPGLVLLVSTLWYWLSHMERCIALLSPGIQSPMRMQHLFVLILLTGTPGSASASSMLLDDWTSAADSASPAQTAIESVSNATAPTAIPRRLSAVTAKDWAELKSLCEAGGNEVTLSQSFDASSYPGPINFSGKSCVIQGSGQTFDLGQQGRFAHGYGSGSSLEMHGLTIKNGKSTSYPGGGAISADGSNGAVTVTISDTTFDSNMAPGGGGAIHIGSGTLIIQDSTFERNEAANDFGGAISIESGTLIIQDSTFERNEATSDTGGAIYIDQGTLTIHDSTFASNRALQNIFNRQSTATVAIVDCSFDDGEDEKAGIDGSADFYCNRGSSLSRPTSAPPKCVSCPVGRFSSAGYPKPTCGECTACPAGMYGTKTQATSLADGCKSCLEGKYQEAAASEGCQDCPQGRYGQFPGEVSSNCTGLCPPSLTKLCTAGTASPRFPIVGHYLANLSTKLLLKCPPGKFKATLDFNDCESCTMGKYQGDEGQFFCLDCGAGSITDKAAAAGATTCTPCAAGKYSTASTDTSCTDCGAGSITNTGTSAGASSCTECSAGKYSTTSAVASCADCAAGSITNTAKAAGATTCTTCTAGTYSTASTDTSCTDCGAGSITNTGTSAGASSCTECSAGKYSTTSAVASCADCAAGSITNTAEAAGATTCTACTAGTHSMDPRDTSCTDCRAGSITNTGSAAGATGCTACATGKYSTTSNVDACIDCDEGEYAADDGSSTCIQCQPGKYQSARGKSYCSDCAAGSITDKTGGEPGAKTCAKCPAGTYSMDPRDASCTDCGAGSITNTGTSAGATTCAECSAGKYSTTSAVASCTDCEPNKYQNSSKQTACVDCAKCPAGARQACGKSAGGYCVDCPPGRFVNALKNGACSDCPKGKYQNLTNEASCTKCGNCSVGGRQGCRAANEGICSVCYPGRYLAGGRCEDCKAHQFQPKRNQPDCKECPRGKYQNAPGQVYCEETPAGQMITLRNGQASLRNCLAGQFSSTSAPEGCQQCEPGKVQPMGNQPLCEPCAGKQYIWRNPVTQELDGKHCDNCPQPGASCDGTDKTYDGGYWHDPNVKHPGHSAPGLPPRPGGAESTKIYTCVNDGCPDKGAAVMECKRGYHGPLCAVCDEGWFLQLRSCKACEGSGPGATTVGLFIATLLVVIGLAATVVRHRRFLASTGVFAHVKILVSFVTIMLTVDRQFGVTWPPAFQRALAALSVLSLDFGILASLLCIVRLSFYANLLCTTLLLVALLGIIYVTYALLQYRHRQATSAHPPDHPETFAKAAEIRRNALFVGVYLLAFAYPAVSIKVVELFGCHNVEGTYYLRADYSLECYTSKWTAMAVYASVFLVIYVVGFPLFVGATLWSYRHALRKQVQGPGQVCKLVPPGLLLGFLLDDYVLRLPCYMWETEEMGRKLSLSVVGNFWSNKSVMSIGTALIISLVFQLGHTRLHPFKSSACNRLQHICLSVLNAVYIAGLLLKTQAVGTTDERDLGVLLVLLLVAAIVAVGCGMAFEIRFLLHAWTRTAKLTALLRKLPQRDPPDGSSAFYDIQIPVQESNMGDAFEPKKPEELAGISNDSKLAVVRQLSEENEQLLGAFLYRVSHAAIIPLQHVRAPMLVKSEGRMCVEWGRKTEESIVKKACRPEIHKKHPKFNIEHVRDTFRFRATVYSFRDIIEFILAMHGDPSLSGQGGLTPGNVDSEGNWLILGKTASSTDQSLWSSQSGRLLRTAGNVAKLDIKKLVKPRKTGWRFMALDFIMPNHQIVECYIRFYEMMLVADMKPAEYGDNEASVCADLNQHEMFEKWRVHDTSSAKKLQAEYDKDKQVQSRADFAKKWDVDKQKYGGYDADDLYGEYERDMVESNRRFDQAFRQVLSHTSALELQEFGKLVGLGSGIRWVADSGTAAAQVRAQEQAGGIATQQFLTNPMAVAEGWRTGAVKDKRSGSSATGTIEFEHANPALDESGAAAAAERSQLQLRSV